MGIEPTSFAVRMRRSPGRASPASAVTREGLAPSYRFRLEHLKLVCLLIPPPSHGVTERTRTAFIQVHSLAPRPLRDRSQSPRQDSNLHSPASDAGALADCATRRSRQRKRLSSPEDRWRVAALADPVGTALDEIRKARCRKALAFLRGTEQKTGARSAGVGIGYASLHCGTPRTARIRASQLALPNAKRRADTTRCSSRQPCA